MENSDSVLPCADKLSFDTKAEAEGSATVAEWQYGNKLKTYKCGYCELWHLASTTEKI